jgi:tetratricopeptide (TPR) repeat protein
MLQASPRITIGFLTHYAQMASRRLCDFDPSHSRGPVILAQSALPAAGLYEFAEEHLRKFIENFVVPENHDGDSCTAALALMKILVLRGRALFEVAQSADWARKYNDAFETRGSARNLFRGEITLESARALALAGEVGDTRKLLEHMRKSRATVHVRDRIDVALAMVEHLAAPASSRAKGILDGVTLVAGQEDEDLLIELGQAYAFIGDASGALNCVDRALLAWPQWSGRRHPMDIILSKFAQPLHNDELFAPVLRFTSNFVAGIVAIHGNELRKKLNRQLECWPLA